MMNEPIQLSKRAMTDAICSVCGVTCQSWSVCMCSSTNKYCIDCYDEHGNECDMMMTEPGDPFKAFSDSDTDDNEGEEAQEEEEVEMNGE